jgi:hypothetical protein
LPDIVGDLIIFRWLQSRGRAKKIVVGEDGKIATLANALSGAPAFDLKPDEAMVHIKDLQKEVANLWRGA